MIRNSEAVPGYTVPGGSIARHRFPSRIIPMKTTIILIDYENVQSIDLKPLQHHDVQIKVFHGATQKFSSDFLHLALDFGKTKFEIVQISGAGKNALDFHIAYYIGKLSKEIENPEFYVISKDTGFKPLIEYIKTHEKLPCFLKGSLSELPLGKPAAVVHTVDRLQLVTDALKKNSSQRPKRRKTLRNQIIQLCKKEIGESEADALIQNLVKEQIIEISGESIAYKI
jgi:hypothetical protein